MKAALCGQKEIAIKSTELLLKKGIDVAFVVPNQSDTGADTWQPSFKKWALEKKLNIVESKPGSLAEALKEHKADILFSIYYDRIFRKKIIEMVPGGIINMHLAPLPRYRGVAPVTMAILNGETEHGVTLHYVNEGIDTGDIISQKHFSIAGMNANLAFAEAMENCAALFAESLDNILSGSIKRIKQDNSKALYFPRHTIDWTKSHIVEDNSKFFNKDTRSLYNWFRAFIFPPMQYPVITIRNKIYEVTAAEPVYTHNKHEKTGTIMEFNAGETGFTALVSTHDSYIKLELREKNG